MSLPQYNPYGTTNTSNAGINPFATQTTYGGYQPSPSYNPAHQTDNRQSVSQNWVDSSATGPIAVYKTETGGTHSYAHEERRSFVAYVNDWLANDPDLRGIIPINPESDDIFTVVATTPLLSKLVNVIAPGTIDERLIKKNANSVYQQQENLTHALDGCKRIGLQVSSMGVPDLSGGKPHMILGLLWQVIRKGLLSQVNMDLHPELSLMIEDHETVQFKNATPDQNLLRWVNFQLKRTNYPKQVNNLRTDIMDGQAYLALMEAIAPEYVPKDVFTEPDMNTRVDWVCAYAKQMGLGGVISPQDIKSGNEKLNLAFTAYLFNKYPGLEQYALNSADVGRKEDDIRRRELELQQREEQMRMQLQQEREAFQRQMMETQRMQQQQQQDQYAQEAEKKRLEGEQQAKLFEEARLRHERELAEAKRAEEERRRQYEAMLRQQEEQRLREEEARRREEEDRRQEEERRRRAEEEERRRRQEEEEQRRRQAELEEQRRRQAELEEMQRRQAEEEARRKAWDEYNRQQANARELQLEEERRRAAWDEYNRQEQLRQEQARLAAEEEERKRQQAWAEYNAQQEALRQQQQAQEAIRKAQEAAQSAQLAQQAAARAAAEQQALLQQQALLEQQRLAALTTVVTPPRPTSQVNTTTVTTTVISTPSVFPIRRLIVKVKMARRLRKKGISMPDPYVKALYNGTYQRSSTLKDTCDPKWEHDFEFLNVDKIDLLTLQVYDDCVLSKDEFLGEVRLSGLDCGHNGMLKEIDLRSREHRVDKVHGTLYIEFKHCK